MTKKRKSQQAVDSRSTRARLQTVVVLGKAAKEGREILSEGQYLHVKDLLKQLVGFAERDFESNLTLGTFHEFWALKEKGGILGNKNLRVYFKHHPPGNEVVVLHAYKKEDEGSPPPDLKIKLRNRWNCYLNGTFDSNLITYTRE